MKKPKFAHKSLHPNAAEPFDNAEEAHVPRTAPFLERYGN